jgi:threonine/homoserine/homoserine lactone efflux protein
MPVPVLQFGVPGAIELLIVLLVLFLSVIVPLAVSYYIYRDAKRRDSRHALAWGVGAFFGSIVVWILYFVVRDEVGTGRPA